MRIHRQQYRGKSISVVGYAQPSTNLFEQTSRERYGIKVSSSTHIGSLILAARATTTQYTCAEMISPFVEAPKRSSGRPLTASQWVEHNPLKLQRYAGNWVAVTQKGVVASANDFDAVFQMAKDRGILNPLVFKVPKSTVRSKIVSVKAL